MKKPTKAQRHSIYKKALERFDHDTAKGYQPFLCVIIEYVSDFQRYEFSELSKQRPKTAEYTWWPSNPKGNAARRRALLRCIELSAQTKRTK